MNNLSYCGLVDARIRASDNNLPVLRREPTVIFSFPYLLTVLLSITLNKLPWSAAGAAAWAVVFRAVLADKAVSAKAAFSAAASRFLAVSFGPL